MIIKNLTFVVPVKYEADFLTQAFKATDSISSWVEEIKAYKLLEQVDPESFNFAIQLGFSDATKLDTFNRQILENMIGEIQSGIDQPVLYFESHLKKVF